MGNAKSGVLIGVFLLAGCTVDRYRRRRVPPPRKALPVAQLPPHIQPAAGKISLLTGTAAGGSLTLYLVNLSDEGVHIATQDRDIPAVLEFEDADGTFKPASRWRGSSCGNSYYSVELPRGHFWRWGHAIPFDSFDGEMARVRVRLLQTGVFQGERNVLATGGMTTAVFNGRYDPDAVARLKYSAKAMFTWPAERLLATLKGEGLPDIHGRYLFEIREDARRVLMHHKLPKGTARQALPAVVKAPRAHGLRTKHQIKLALKKWCRADPVASTRFVDALLAGAAHPERRIFLKGGFGCDLHRRVREILTRVDDPDLDVVVPRLCKSLERTYRTDLADALTTFAANQHAPDDLRAQAQRALKDWGRHQVRFKHGPGRRRAIGFIVDIRSERPITACAAHQSAGRNLGTIPCVQARIWGASGWIMQRTPTNGNVQIDDGPLRFRLDDVAVPPSTPLGTYCLEARPIVHVPGLTMPTIEATFETKDSKWGRQRTFLREKCPFLKPATQDRLP